jgi:phage repressor protein C with HTH and peptisase S24 domain
MASERQINKEAAERTERVIEAGDSRKLEQGVERDSEGRVSRVSLDRRVADPTSPEAVQVPANTVPASHDRQLGMEGQDEVTNDDIEQLDANNVKLGDITEASPAAEVLAGARAELDEANEAAEAARAEGVSEQAEAEAVEANAEQGRSE